MSKVSEKRERQAQAKPSLARKVLTVALIVAAFAAVAYLGLRKRGNRFDTFAKCLAAKQAKMYGAYWCPHCAEQKEMFESSFQYVPYVECGVPGSRDEAPGLQGRRNQAFSHLAVCRRGTRGRHTAVADSRHQGRMRSAMMYPCVCPAHFTADRGAGVGRRGGLIGLSLSSLRHVADFVLRRRRKFQLRHCEPQHLLGDRRGSGGIDRHYRIHRPAGAGYFLSRPSRNSGNVGARFAGWAGLRTLPYLH